MLTAPGARALLEMPYIDEANASRIRAMQRAARPPRTLTGLVRWFALAWHLELPHRDWVAGVWSAPQQYDRPDGAHWATPQGDPRWPPELVGGSVLGSPRLSDYFRRYIENSDYELDADGYYVRPMHAALARLLQGGPHRPPMPLTTRDLFYLGWSGAQPAVIIAANDEQRDNHLFAALLQLWALYHPIGLR